MKYCIGMDLASESVEFYVMTERGRRMKRGKMSWSMKKWSGLIERYGAENVVVAFESGPEAYRAQAQFDKLGVETYPFHAAHFPMIWKSKKKTDRIDAEKICLGLVNRSLPEKVFVPEKELRILRGLMTEREMYLKQYHQLTNRVSGKAREHGVSIKAHTSRTAQRWWEEVIESFPKERQQELKRLYRTGMTLLQGMDELKEQIMVQVEKAGMQDAVDRLMTIPGIGRLSACALVAYLGNGERFTRGRKVASYIGVTPSVDKTGKQRARLGHITKEGPSVLRRLLVQSANAAIKSRKFQRTHYWEWFKKITDERGYKIAIVALARKLVILAYALLRDESTFDPTKLGMTAS